MPDEVLDDLRSRLLRTRYTTRSGSDTWEGGADPDYLRDLIAYWATEFSWRDAEANLNQFPHYRALIDGHAVHFIHLRANRPPRSPVLPPLLLSHGWPSSFVEMLPLAQRLSDPGRYGHDPDAAFDVVVASLPGFAYSDLPDHRLTRATLAQTLHRLMTSTLGYQRYGAFGGDVGGAATTWLGALYPDEVAGIHLIHPPFPSEFGQTPLTREEQAFIDAEEAYDQKDGGYSAIMATRPDTIAAALVDSPAGLAAWIVDKYRDWSDCAGDLETRFDRDSLLTILTLYWATGSIGTSFRQYFDWGHNTDRPLITVPTAVTLSAEASMKSFPRSIAERACSDIRFWNEPGRGGHFMPWEEPEILAKDISSFFTSLHRP